MYRLVALDIETGSVQYHTDYFGVQLDEVTKNIFSIASNGWTVIDTQTFTIKEDYFFSKEDPEEMGQYESVYKPLLQGDYFTFIGSKHKEYGGIGWIGIFDYKARKLVWEYELLPFEERKATRNRLVAPQPLYIKPDPWDLVQPQDAMSRHRGAKPLRRCELLGVISLLFPG